MHDLSNPNKERVLSLCEEVISQTGDIPLVMVGTKADLTKERSKIDGFVNFSICTKLVAGPNNIYAPVLYLAEQLTGLSGLVLI